MGHLADGTTRFIGPLLPGPDLQTSAEKSDNGTVRLLGPLESWSANYASTGLWRDFLWRIPPIGFFFAEIRGAGPCQGASTGFMGASGGVLSEGQRQGGPGVCRAMARLRPKKYRQKVDATTHCFGVLDLPDLTQSKPIDSAYGHIS